MFYYFKDSAKAFRTSTSLSDYNMRSTAEELRVFVGLFIFWVTSHFPLSPVKSEGERDRLWDKERQRVCQ